MPIEKFFSTLNQHCRIWSAMKRYSTSLGGINFVVIMGLVNLFKKLQKKTIAVYGGRFFESSVGHLKEGCL